MRVSDEKWDPSAEPRRSTPLPECAYGAKKIVGSKDPPTELVLI